MEMYVIYLYVFVMCFMHDILHMILSMYPVVRNFRLRFKTVPGSKISMLHEVFQYVTSVFLSL